MQELIIVHWGGRIPLCFGTSLDIFCFTLPEEDTKIQMPSTIMQNQETNNLELKLGKHSYKQACYNIFCKIYKDSDQVVFGEKKMIFSQKMTQITIFISKCLVQGPSSEISIFCVD